MDVSTAATVDSELSTLVAAFRVHEHSELEVLMTSTVGSGGVPFNVFNKLFDSLSLAATRGVVLASAKTAIIDFHYADNVRTRYVAGKSPVSIRKTRLAKYDMVCPQRPNICLRLNLKNETPIPVALVSESSPLLVRLQESWVFSYGGKFEYHLKKTVSGINKQTACKSLPLYEIELELLRNPTWMAETSDDDIAANILCKMMDLCGRYTSDGTKCELTILPRVPIALEQRLESKKIIAARRRREQRKRKAVIVTSKARIVTSSSSSSSSTTRINKK